MEPILPLAAIVYPHGEAPEPLLAAVVEALAEKGVRLGGMIQHNLRETPEDMCDMVLQNLDGDERIQLSQSLGPGAEACRLDTHALAHAAGLVRESLARGVDLVVFNKFGALEAAGEGFRDEMGAVVSAGVPLLTCVPDRLLESWRSFTGRTGAELAFGLAPALAWWDSLPGGYGD